MRLQTRGRTLLQFALAAVLVVAFTATATAVAGLLQFKEAAHQLDRTPAITHARVVIPQPGDAQTVLVIGSDHRAGQPLSASHSDTIILVRIDPSSSTINVLSIPRDLRVTIPGGRGVAKINEAYSLGGPNLLVKTIQANVFRHLQVSHIVDINFGGFRALVDAIGCVYTDVDRRYFNVSSPGANNYSSIDIQPGYQKLCGENALAYVRYRHTDTDIVRSARQQDFIRQAKDQYGQANLISNRNILLGIFGAHTQTDADLHSATGLENLFNLIAFSDLHGIRTVHFPALLQPCTPPAPCYVDADPAAEADAFRQLMAVVPARAPTTATGSTAHPAGVHLSARPGSLAAQGLALDPADAAAQLAALKGLPMPVYAARAVALGSVYQTQATSPTPNAYPRKYTIGRYPAYRIVVAQNAVLGQYYGIEGTTWHAPPLLAPPLEDRVINGRTFELHWDGRHLRLVALRTPHAVYWVSNTLSLSLSNAQMLGLAASLTKHP